MCGFTSSAVQLASHTPRLPRDAAYASAASARKITGPNCAFAIALNIGCDHSATRSSGRGSITGQVRARSAIPASTLASSTISHAASATGSGSSEIGVIAIAEGIGYTKVRAQCGTRPGSVYTAAAHVARS